VWKTFIDQLSPRIPAHLFEGGERSSPDFEELRPTACAVFMSRSNPRPADRRGARSASKRWRRRPLVELFATLGGAGELTGQPGSFEAVINGIRNAALPASRSPSRDPSRRTRAPAALLDLAVELGCEQVGVWALSFGRAKRNWGELSLSLVRMMHALHGSSATRRAAHHLAPAGRQLLLADPRRDPQGIPSAAPICASSQLRHAYRPAVFVTWDHPLFQQLRSNAVGITCGVLGDAGHFGGCVRQA